jgi:phospholipase/carboxylesterase
MSEHAFQGIELLPSGTAPKQLFLMLHGVGATSSGLLPLAHRIRNVLPDSALLIPDGTFPFDGGGNGRQWFSIRGVTEENRILRVAEAMPDLFDLVRREQSRFSVLPVDTTLMGFSQGAIMALEFSIAHDGSVGRVVSFSGRFARIPEKAPKLTTIHFLHGENDPVVSVTHAQAGFDRLVILGGNATLDLASSTGHEINAVLAERAASLLQTSLPDRNQS